MEPAAKISEYLRYIPRQSLGAELMDLEDDALHKVAGNVYALETCYRWLVRRVCRDGALPAAMPRRLGATVRRGHRGGLRRGSIVEPVAFRTIRRRLSESLRQLAMGRMCLRPIKTVVFEAADMERGRREAMYARQVEQIEEILRGWEQVNSPMAQAVFCSNGMSFQSTRKAAEWASGATGRTIKRSHLRTAMKRGCSCGGFQWGYDTRHTARIIPGRALPVRCVELAISFPTRSEAAAFAGVSAMTMRTALSRDGKLRRGEPAIEVLTFQVEAAPRPERQRHPGLFDWMLAEAG